jgi:hypothetical protein
VRNLDEDRDEMDTESGRAWVRQSRAAYGIKHDEGATWVVRVSQDKVNGEFIHDYHELFLGPSPGDVLSLAVTHAEVVGGRRTHTGRWILETFGDGENSPVIMRVIPVLDEEGYRDEA